MSDTTRGPEVTRSEEEVRLHTITREVGKVRARKVIGSESYDQVISREVQEAEVEHVPTGPGDSGQVETLEDGSISIPVFEEEIVIEKRLVLRERIVIRKRTVTEQHRVSTDLRKERVEIEVDSSAAFLVKSDLDTAPAIRS